jgi:hypothetical protein
MYLLHISVNVSADILLLLVKKLFVESLYFILHFSKKNASEILKDMSV